MKTITLQLSFVLFFILFILPFSPGWAQTIPSFEDPYKENIEKGVQALREHNTRLAIHNFELVKRDARKNKNREKKVEAKDLIRKAKHYYKDYFSLLQRIERHAVQREFKAALADCGQAVSEAIRIVNFSIEPVQAFDAQLLADARKREGQVKQQRSNAYQQAVSTGTSAMSAGKPKLALAHFEYAQSQADNGYANSGHLDNQITDATYNIWRLKGERQFDWGNYELALRYFDQANRIKDNGSLDNRIRQVKTNLYEQQLELADILYEQEAYALSAKMYHSAEQYEDTRRVYNSKRIGRYEGLLWEGKQEFDRKAYYNARIHFRNAKHFDATPEVEGYLEEVEQIIQYSELMAEGKNLMAEDKLDEALDHFSQAAALHPTDEVEQQLKRIKDYREYINSGRSAMSQGQPEEAVRKFKKARALIYTPQVTELIAKAASMYTDVTVIVTSEELLGKDLNQAVLFLEDISGQGQYQHQQDYRGGKAHFFDLKPGTYQAYIRGVKEKGMENEYPPMKELRYQEVFELDGGKVEITLSVNKVLVKNLIQP